VIHWYRQKQGEAPQRFLYSLGDKPAVESGFQEDRYMVEKVSEAKECILTIIDVIPDDAATYYCAYWDLHHVWSTWIKYFGAGTKLIVSKLGNSPPENSEIMQAKHENKITYVCLIEKFYPDVIRVKWTDGEKEITDNVVKGDAWKPTTGDKYSIGSWLTVPEENKDKKYHCKYEHESKQGSLETEEKPNQGILTLFPLAFAENTMQGEDCTTQPGNSPTLNGDHLMHRTAYLVYLVLLLKSSMYYLIIVFSIYR
ncbi:TRGC1 protein, partial [Rhinopomastus cyanomelas]|nr:TRGC1 protein [Rhinopomastus cyanomelas]